MRQLLVVLLLVASGFSQGVRISPTEAVKQCVKQPSPTYPPFALTARIQGRVILEVRIDKNGVPKVWRTVSGHPLLVPAAVESFKEVRYKPFAVDGTVSDVMTFAVVHFFIGHSAPDPEGDAELVFLHDFWTSEEKFQEAFGQKDYRASESFLSHCQELVLQQKQFPGLRENQTMFTDFGDLRAAQGRTDDAEQFFHKAVDLTKSLPKDFPETGFALSNLGRFYFRQGRLEQAREPLARSQSILKSNFKQTNEKQYPDAKRRFGTAVAETALLLCQIALQRSDEAELRSQCKVGSEFETYLTPDSSAKMAKTCRSAASVH